MKEIAKAAITTIVYSALIVLSACGIGRETVSLEGKVTLRDGERWVNQYVPGRYKLSLVADKDPVSVKWVGADCPESIEPRNTYLAVCEFQKIGRTVIENPTGSGLGEATIVTIRVTRLR